MRLVRACEMIPVGVAHLQEMDYSGPRQLLLVRINHSLTTLKFFRHEQVWSPAGGWWPTPVAWKRNTAVAYLCIGVISSMIFKVSAEKERRPIEPFKPGGFRRFLSLAFELLSQRHLGTFQFRASVGASTRPVHRRHELVNWRWA